MIADAADTDLVAMLRAIVRHELAALALPRSGVVEAVHGKGSDAEPGNFECDVALHGGDAVLHRVPIATGHIGSVDPLRPGELVLVQFLQGDANRPVVVGRLYGDETRVPDHAPGEMLLRLPPEGGGIDCSLDPSAPAISLEVSGEMALSITPKTATVSSGEFELTLDVDGGAITATTGSATVTLGDDGSVAIECDGDFSVAAKGKVQIDGAAGAVLNSDGTTDVTGAVVNIN